MDSEVQIEGHKFTIPYADLLPALSTQEYNDLKADIVERGIVVPIILGEGNRVIDGQHRMRIAAELGLTLNNVPREMQAGLTEDEEHDLCIDLNVHRRQLNPDERQDAALKLRQSGQSYRQIGEALGVSHETARADIERATVKNLTVAAQALTTEDSPSDYKASLPLPERVTGRDGISRPATMPRPAAPPAPEEAPYTYPVNHAEKWPTEPHETEYETEPTPITKQQSFQESTPDSVRRWMPPPTHSAAAQATAQAIIDTGRDDYIAQDFDRLIAYLLGATSIAGQVVRTIPTTKVASVLTSDEIANGRRLLPMLEFVLGVYADYDRQKLRVVR